MRERMRHQRIKVLIGLALGLITLAVYLPAIHHEFLDYDDQEYVAENPHVRAGLTWQGVVWTFGQHASNWHPLTWLSHMTDCQLYGLKPAGHHLTNVLLHVANTVLLFLVLNRMTGTKWRSAAVAALFGWHPLHVESVAWVAERKDVLSAFFFMLTIGAYAKYAELQGEVKRGESGASERHKSGEQTMEFQRRLTSAATPEERKSSARYYLLALALFALGLMSKPMVVTVPFVMLLLDYCPLGRIGGRRRDDGGQRTEDRGQKTERGELSRFVLEKVPFFLLSAIACVLTLSAQRQGNAIVSTSGLPIGLRFEHALVSYMHYLGAAFVPRHLAVHYPYETTIPAWMIVISGFLLCVITAGVFRFANRRPYLLVGWLWFLGTLVPVIGLAQVGDQAWADRYTYLPLIGLFIGIVWGVFELGTKLWIRSPQSQINPKSQTANPGVSRPSIIVFSSLVATALGGTMLAATSRQLCFWKNTRTLFEHAERVTRNNYMAITLLGSLLAKEGRTDVAVEHYETALRYKPDYAEAHFFLGQSFDQRGKLDQAIAEYRRALRSKPAQEQTHIFLGLALAKEKKDDEAASHYLAALKLNPESAVAHNNLARLLQSQGRLDDAIAHYFGALKLDPGLAQAHNNLGVLLLQKGRLAEGTAELRAALRPNHDNSESEFNLALALNQQEQWNEAAALFAKTVSGSSIDPNAHMQFAKALARLPRTRQAMSEYARALLLRPDFPEALDGLSWILSTAPDAEFRNGVEAVRMAERACELTGRKDPAKLKTLAAAYAETARFPEAIANARTAEELAAGKGLQAIVGECRLMSANFRDAKPWRAGQ